MRLRIAYGLLLLLMLGGTAFAHRPIEIILRDPPPQVPSQERLYLAERLYALDRLDEASHWLQTILADRAPESPEALLLLGRIDFSRGEPSKCLARFNRLYAYYPQSMPLTGGELAHFASKALEILVEEQQYDRCGGYIDLLKEIDPQAVSLAADRLEKQIDHELYGLQGDLAGLKTDVGSLLGQVSEEEMDETRIEAVGSCPAGDDGCVQVMAQKARSYRDRVQGQAQDEWNHSLAGRYEQAKAVFARQGLEAAQAYSLLRHLLDDRILSEAIEPKAITGVPAPYAISIIEREFYRYRKGLDKYLKGSEIKMTGWRIEIRPLPEALQAGDAIPMGFGAIDRQLLLKKLGDLLYSNSGVRISWSQKL